MAQINLKYLQQDPSNSRGSFWFTLSHCLACVVEILPSPIVVCLSGLIDLSAHTTESESMPKVTHEKATTTMCLALAWLWSKMIIWSHTLHSVYKATAIQWESREKSQTVSTEVSALHRTSQEAKSWWSTKESWNHSAGICLHRVQAVCGENFGTEGLHRRHNKSHNESRGYSQQKLKNDWLSAKLGIAQSPRRLIPYNYVYIYIYQMLVEEGLFWVAAFNGSFSIVEPYKLQLQVGRYPQTTYLLQACKALWRANLMETHGTWWKLTYRVVLSQLHKTL